jgi:hypothetical protein
LGGCPALLRCLTLLVFVRRDAWAAAVGLEPVASACVSLVGLLEAPGTVSWVFAPGACVRGFRWPDESAFGEDLRWLGGRLAGLVAWLV